MSSRLASMLVQDGHVSAPRMAEAFQRQVIYGGTLDTILLEMGLVDEELAVEYLGRAAELPVAAPPPAAAPGEESKAQLWFPRTVAEQFRTAPIGLAGRTARVMVTEAPDPATLAQLKELLGLELVAQVAPEFRLHQALERHYGVPVPARYASLAAKLKQRAETQVRSGTRKPARREVRILDAEPPGIDEAPPRRIEMAVAAAARPASEPPPSVEAVPEPIHDSPLAEDAARLRLEAHPAPLEPYTPPPEDASSSEPLTQADGLAALADAAERDRIFEVLCRMARQRFAFAAVFTVQADQALARMALARSGWLQEEVIGEVKVPLGTPSSFRAAINGRAPYLGRLDDDPPTSQALAMLGRPQQLWGALLPMVIRDRTVAVLQVDDGGAVHESSEVADLILAAAEAARAFQRIILAAKAGKLSKAPAKSAPREEAPIGPAAASHADDLRKFRRPRPEGAQRTEEPPTDPGFRRAMRSPDADGDVAAALGAVERGGGSAAAAAESLLASGEEAARALAARLPGPLRLDRHELAGNAAPPLQEHGPLLALVPRFGRAIVPHLVARLTDPSLDVRFYVTTAFTELRFPEAVAPLGKRLFDADPTVRRAAVGALSRFEPSPELRTLLEGLRGDLIDPNPAQQRNAAEALGELRDATSVPRLIELVKNREPELVEAARRALIQITKQDFGTSRWRWRSWWDRHRAQSRIEWMLAGLAHRDAEVRLSASDELQSLTSDYFGYHFELSRRDREEARQKWAAWYKQNSGTVRPSKERW